MIYLSLIFAGICLLLMGCCGYFFRALRQAKHQTQTKQGEAPLDKLKLTYLKKSVRLWSFSLLFFLIATATTTLAAQSSISDASFDRNSTTNSSVVTTTNKKEAVTNTSAASRTATTTGSSSGERESTGTSSNSMSAASGDSNNSSTHTDSASQSTSNSNSTGEQSTKDLENQAALEVEPLIESDDKGLAKIKGKVVDSVKQIVVSNTELDYKKTIQVTNGTFEFDYQLKSGETEMTLYLCDEKLAKEVSEDERVRVVVVPNMAFQEEYFKQLEASQESERKKTEQERK